MILTETICKYDNIIYYIGLCINCLSKSSDEDSESSDEDSNENVSVPSLSENDDTEGQEASVEKVDPKRKVRNTDEQSFISKKKRNLN